MSGIRGKRNTAWTPDKVRERIRTGLILRRVQEHALGNIEMTQTQLKAAEILLRKAVPDLRSIEHSGTVTNRYVHEHSDAELAAIASGSSARVADATDSSPEPQGVH